MIEYLKKASKAYYEGEPSITDQEYDYLASLHNFNQLGTSPHPVGSIPHFNRLYSLDKFYEGDKLPFASQNVILITTPKLDGAAVSITYVDGLLSTVATRGDGYIGEDITNNFIGWEGIPQSIDYDGIVQVVGEIVAPSTVENSRNYAAGANRLKDKKEFASRNIQFVAYSLFFGKGRGSSYYLMDMTLLKQMGFRVVTESGLDKVYPTDGLVFRLNDCEEYYDAGFTAKHPKGAFALKDADEFEVKETTLLDVIWQNGKSGKVTPVAIFEPIILEDAKVSKATLNNAGFVEDLNLSIGDTLLVTRAGGIIPKILGTV